MKKAKGFTLVELLLVIAIIAILTSVILANLAQARAKARDTERISSVSQLQLALALYLNRNGYYPQNLDALITPVKFIGAIPKDPTSKAYFDYATDVNGTTYCLGATLETTSNYTTTSSTCSSGNTANNYKVSK